MHPLTQNKGWNSVQSILLSQSQLLNLMHLLRDALVFFDKQFHPKVSFFNEWCLYRHICGFNIHRMIGKKRRRHFTIGMLLDVLEPYIPCRLTDENFDLFMEAALTPKEPRPQFSHKAKLDFVIALRGITDYSQWEQMLAVCESIRVLKETLIMHPFKSQNWINHE